MRIFVAFTRGDGKGRSTLHLALHGAALRKRNFSSPGLGSPGRESVRP